MKPMKTNSTKRMRRLRKRALARQAMTLIEIMVVMVIIAMIAGGAAVVVSKQLEKARVKQAVADCSAIRSAADLYRMDHQSDCPSVEQLKESGELRRDGNSEDPWGKPYVVDCSEGEVVVSSPGKDGQAGTEDDVR